MDSPSQTVAPVTPFTTTTSRVSAYLDTIFYGGAAERAILIRSGSLDVSSGYAQVISMPIQTGFSWYSAAGVESARIESGSQGTLDVFLGGTADHPIDFASGLTTLYDAVSLSPAAATASLTLNTPSTSYQDAINFNVAGGNHWEMGMQTSADTAWFLYNAGLSEVAINVDYTTDAVSIAKTLQVKTVPTSAGTGGLYLCIDSTGNIYKKASCP